MEQLPKLEWGERRNEGNEKGEKNEEIGLSKEEEEERGKKGGEDEGE